MELPAQPGELLAALIGVGLLLAALLVVLYFFRGVIRVTKACLILVLAGVLVLLLIAGVLVLSSGVL
jgi:hypothetical protein